MEGNIPVPPFARSHLEQDVLGGPRQAEDLVAGLLTAAPTVAGEMRAEEAHRFVVGKLFSFQCFEGTSGMGRVYADGSVSGGVQLGGTGPMRYVNLPAGTLRVKGEMVCALMKGIPFEICFDLYRTDPQSFRGSVSGLRFASCQFTRNGGRSDMALNASPLSIQPELAASGGR